MNKWTTVRAYAETKRKLEYLSREKGQTFTSLVADAVDRYYRDFILEETNRQYVAERNAEHHAGATTTDISGYDASDWLAADHAGLLRTGDVPRGERADSPARRPRNDLSCPTCGAAFGDDCGCGLAGYDERDGYTLHERLVSGE